MTPSCTTPFQQKLMPCSCKLTWTSWSSGATTGSWNSTRPNATCYESRALSHHPPMTIPSNLLWKVDSAKYLGVTVSSNLKFNKHVRQVRGSAEASLKLLNMLKRNLRNEILRSRQLPIPPMSDPVLSTPYAPGTPGPVASDKTALAKTNPQATSAKLR